MCPPMSAEAKGQKNELQADQESHLTAGAEPPTTSSPKSTDETELITSPLASPIPIESWRQKFQVELQEWRRSPGLISAV